uniref:BZIP domain-containing protein n=1 Tax=Globodera rostochiensis TaxID=31243 RepID=A0A914IF63_GLORO
MWSINFFQMSADLEFTTRFKDIISTKVCGGCLRRRCDDVRGLRFKFSGKMRTKRGAIGKRNSNARASNNEQSDENSGGEMSEREQRRVISNRLSQQRYREKGNEARDLLPQLYKRIADLERENNLLKDQLWRQRDPNGYAMAQQQQKEWTTDGPTNNVEVTAPNAFPQRVMSETSIPSLFNGHQPVQRMVSNIENCVGQSPRDNEAVVAAAEWQPANVNAVAPPQGTSFKMLAAVLLVALPEHGPSSGQVANANCAPFPASPQTQYLSAGTNYGPCISPQPYSQQQLADGGQWWISSSGAQPQSPPQQQQHRCRSASITATPSAENAQILFNTSMGSNFGQSMPRQQQHSPAESSFEAPMVHQQQHFEPAYVTNGNEQLLSGPPAPKRSSSFTDMCSSYQQMNIQETMQVHAQVNDLQYHQQPPLQQQQQQQVDGFFAPPFAYGIELDPNGPQSKVTSANQAAQFAAFDRIAMLTPINEDTPRLYLEH